MYTNTPPPWVAGNFNGKMDRARGGCRWLRSHGWLWWLWMAALSCGWLRLAVGGWMAGKGVEIDIDVYISYHAKFEIAPQDHPRMPTSRRTARPAAPTAHSSAFSLMLCFARALKRCKNEPLAHTRTHIHTQQGGGPCICSEGVLVSRRSCLEEDKEGAPMQEEN